jgi:hypothetical protein
LIVKLPLHEQPLRTPEMDTGTEGITAKMASILGDLNMPVEYAVTSISLSLVAAAREYDIEKPPTGI